jgi:UDP-N-acetylglucosamine 2-epimerase (non-hydrolysing)
MKILHVVGARPNFMKVAPVMAAMDRHGTRFEQRLVHTGQHYDRQMSRVFFDELGLPRPDVDLGVGSADHAEQTARVMVAFEPVVADWRPDWVFVVGDVNSTLACALVCAKLHVRVAHLEAGLRSFDRSMPEEINRVVTDQIADLLLTPSADADENLRREGVPPEKVALVGNIMIDTLARLLPEARSRALAARLGLSPGRFVLVTMHRPGNVDDRADLRDIATGLGLLAADVPVVFPVHPRTRRGIDAVLDGGVPRGLRLLEPLGYLDFLSLMDAAGVVVTDSGGVQEETTYLGVPCLTVRPNTERPVTIEVGTNRLVARAPEALVAAARERLAEARETSHGIPPLWDGATAPRVVDALLAASAVRQGRRGEATADAGVST